MLSPSFYSAWESRRTAYVFWLMLIKDVQRPKGFAIIGSAVNKVIGPHVVAMRALQSLDQTKRNGALSAFETMATINIE